MAVDAEGGVSFVASLLALRHTSDKWRPLLTSLSDRQAVAAPVWGRVLGQGVFQGIAGLPASGLLRSGGYRSGVSARLVLVGLRVSSRVALGTHGDPASSMMVHHTRLFNTRVANRAQRRRLISCRCALLRDHAVCHASRH